MRGGAKRLYSTRETWQVALTSPLSPLALCRLNLPPLRGLLHRAGVQEA